MRRPAAIAAATFLLLAPAGSRPALAQDEAAAAGAFRFGPWRTTIAPLSEPAAVAIAADGTIVIAEAGAARLRAFAPDGSEARTIAPDPDGPDALVLPQGLALLGDGRLVVTDGGTHDVRLLGPDGAALARWGGYGTAAGEFNDPRGVAVDAARICVADMGNDRVQVFDREGTFLFAIGSRGDQDGQFRRPVDVAVDEEGFLYVADSDNNRIQKFDADGGFVTAWGDWGPFGGLLDQPTGVVCRGGEVYVADTRNHRLQVFDGDGKLRLQWGIHAVQLHEGEGRLHYPNALAIASSGAFGVIAEAFEARAQIFDVGDPRQPAPAVSMMVKAKQTHFGSSLAVDGPLLAIAEPEGHVTHLFDMRRDVPILIGSFGERGTRFGQMMRTEGLALDLATRRLWITDTATRRVEQFNLDYDPEEALRFSPRRARFAKAYDLALIGARFTAEDLSWPIEPADLVLGADGNLYVLDPRNSMVLVLDPDGRILQGWGGFGTEPGHFRRPTDLAFGAGGETIFVVDASNHRIQAFDRGGAFLRAWGRAGEGPGAFRRPFGIAAGRDGFVYVTDAASDTIQKFTEAGAHVATWGGHGVDHGSLWTPRGIAQDEHDRLIVIDQGNHRAQIFTPDGVWLATFGTGRSFTPESVERERQRAERARQQREGG